MTLSLSIIIPVYKVEHYICRCLDSLMSQQIPRIEVECLLVDDASPDGSMDLAKEMIANYVGPIRFRILSFEENQGLSMARNRGVMEANGDYVLLMDSDDHLFPDSLNYLVSQLKEYPEADVVIGNGLNTKDGSKMLHQIYEPLLITNPTDFLQRLLRRQIYLQAWNKLIRRSLLIDNKIFFVNGILYEDESWSFRLFSSASCVLLLPQLTYIYEYISTSIVNTTYTVEKSSVVVHSYSVSANYIMDNPPSWSLYCHNLMVDYLLFVSNIIMRGMDVVSKCATTPEANSKLRLVRGRLMSFTLRNGRLIVACFLLLLFPPFTSFLRMSLFRKYYYDLEAIVNRLAHYTDFLHRK